MTLLEFISKVGTKINGNHSIEAPSEINRIPPDARYNPQYYLAPPPPIPQQPKENPIPKMLPEGFVDIIKDNSLKKFPTPTSSLDEYRGLCGTTENFMYSGSTTYYGVINETKLDESPLKRMLMKNFKWIEDVTEVKKSNHRPIEVHITVSPIHHTELMIPQVEKIVRKKLYDVLIPLITCMYEDSGKDNPIVIFSPSHSETILEYFK